MRDPEPDTPQPKKPDLVIGWSCIAMALVLAGLFVTRLVKFGEIDYGELLFVSISLLVARIHFRGR